MKPIEHRFQLPGMSCGRCVASIEKALQPMGLQVAADLAGKALRVEAPASVSREQIVQALVDAGYPPAADESR